jgi:primosomal protein N' (replication factor Y)
MPNLANTRILLVAVPSPLRRYFDYLPPKNFPIEQLMSGMRLRVPFGRTQMVGVLVEIASHSEIEPQRLKAVTAVLDPLPLLTPDDVKLLKWASAYYHYSPGEVFASAFPTLLRKGRPAQVSGIKFWRISDLGKTIDPNTLKKAPRQVGLLALLQSRPRGMNAEQISETHQNWQPAMRKLVAKGWVEEEQLPCLPVSNPIQNSPRPQLNEAQQRAVTQVVSALDQFQAFVLEGVTGSGKTEVYLNIVEKVLEQGRQALVLVPEIGLTPQIVARFQRRFTVPVAVLHSGLNDQERLCAWLSVRDGTAPVLIGTRSAVFTPMKDVGVIVIDEEHDLSFKQQEGFRYSARDVAVVRAQNAGIPIVLGSATPSLECLFNVQRGRFQSINLPERAGAAQHPKIRILDVRGKPLEDGLSEPLLSAMHRHLDQGNQVLLFLNRRGYAPTLLCHDCGWVSQCSRCDAHMTVHYADRRQRCHHCGAERPIDRQCPVCASDELRPLGSGTERVENALKEHFPDLGVVRIDRESTRRKGAMQSMLESVRQGQNRILIGTQMLAKGHHFPDVTLVGILNTDQGLFSADFRATERMAQLILQVAGRAGRADRPGEVLIQTHHPDHPVLHLLIEEDYAHFARMALKERQQADLPPYCFFALFRAEAVAREAPLNFLQQVRELAASYALDGVELFGPITAPMERRAGRYRAQLLLQSHARTALHKLLARLAPEAEDLKTGRKVRWSLDVDPLDMF